MFTDNPLLSAVQRDMSPEGSWGMMGGEGLPPGYGSVTPFRSGQSLIDKMNREAPTVSDDPLGVATFFRHNPGKNALHYALQMNDGIPDAVAVTASNMPWMAHWRAGGEHMYQPMPEMQHTALGVLPAYYKMYNQIGGAGAYGGKAGPSANPVTSPDSPGSQEREAWINNVSSPMAGMSPKEQREYKGMWGPKGLDSVIANMRTYGTINGKMKPLGSQVGS